MNTLIQEAATSEVFTHLDVGGGLFIWLGGGGRSGGGGAGGGGVGGGGMGLGLGGGSLGEGLGGGGLGRGEGLGGGGRGRGEGLGGGGRGLGGGGRGEGLGGGGRTTSGRSWKPMLATPVVLSLKLHMPAVLMEQSVAKPRYLMPLAQVARSCAYRVC